MEKLKKKYISKKNTYALILVLFIFAYNFIWLNRTFTLSDCWGQNYIGILKNGKFPYRDFYYYLPPFNLLEDIIIWKLSFNYIIVYRLIRLIQRIIIIEIMYHLMVKRVTPSLAFVGAGISTVLLSANIYDLIGDYNQMHQLLIALLTYITYKYVEQEQYTIQKKFYAITIGILGGIMFLSKQPLVLASIIAFGSLFIVLAIYKYERRFLETMLYIIIGVAIPMGIATYILWYNGALNSFAYQVFGDTGAKGSLYYIIIGKIVNIIIEYKTIIIANIIFILAYERKNTFCKKDNYNYILNSSVILLYFIYINNNNIWISNSVLYVLFAFVIVVASAIFLLVRENVLLSEVIYICLLILIFVCAFLNIGGFTDKIYYETTVFFSLEKGQTIVFLGLVMWFLYHIISTKIKGRQLDVKALVVAAGGISSGYATIMTNGTTGIMPISAFIYIPAVMYIIFRDKGEDNRIQLFVTNIIFMILFVICLAQKMVCPYSWWGDSEASYWMKTESVAIDKLHGFLFSELEKNKIEKITQLIDYYTDETSVIWGFPYTKTYNVLLDNYNLVGTVPVVFYDTCADDFAIKEAADLRENLPDVVVWMDIPGCMETHEQIFRDGNKLGQREIQKWFSDVSEKEYTLVGQVDNVFVYVKNGIKDIDFKFIQQKTRSNETAKYVQHRFLNNEEYFLGEGTKEDPYRIENLDDLIMLRDLVNDGYSFENKYFMQTSDIDLEEVDNWEPIGIYGSGSYFSGNYNGDGYKIENLTIEAQDDNVGFFGQLAGTIENIALIDCNIVGAHVGGIVSQGYGTPTVANCLVTGNITGIGRAGGVVDNINGLVINCVSDVNLVGSISSGIAGYYTNNVINCYSAHGDNISVEEGKPFDNLSISRLNEKINSDEYYNSDLWNEWKLENEKLTLR